MKRSLLFILIIVSVACSSTQGTVVPQDKKSAEQVAQELFDDRFFLNSNKANSYSIIATKHKELKDLFPTLDFVVYDHSAEEIILRDTLKAGNVSWSGNYTIKAIARNLSEDENDQPNRYSYLYDVQKRKVIQ